MAVNSRSLAAVLLFLVAGCASASGGSETAQQPLLFGSGTLPKCSFERMGEIAVSASVKGDRRTAEQALHRALGQAAQARHGDGVVEIRIVAPERVPFVVSGRRRPSDDDLPAVTWRATAQAIRFTDPTCRG